MDIDLEFYKKNGFLHLKNIFSNELISKILKDAKYIFYKQFLEKGYIKNLEFEDLSEDKFNSCLFKLYDEDIEALSNCGKHAQHLISLHKLTLSDEIISLINKLGLSCPSICTRPVLFFNHKKLAKEKIFYKVEAHQDWRSMQGSLNSIVIWVPLIDIDKKLGALEILPGSHLMGLRTTKIERGFGMVNLTEIEERKMKTVEVKQGDLLIFSSFLIHRSGENITPSPRWSCHFRFNDLNEKTFIKRKFAHPYIYKPKETLITVNFPKIDTLQKIFLYEK